MARVLMLRGCRGRRGCLKSAGLTDKVLGNRHFGASQVFGLRRKSSKVVAKIRIATNILIAQKEKTSCTGGNGCKTRHFRTVAQPRYE